MPLPAFQFDPRALLDPAAYPWQPDSVELIETHISWVFLAGEFVVKVKRPVDLGFVDFRSLDQRRAACEDEVRFNRRLTMGVYLDVVPIAASANGLLIEGRGEVVEWATLMRRLPAEGMLDATIARGELEPALARRLAAVLLQFHQNAAVCEPTDDPVAAQTAVVIANLDALAAFTGNILPQSQLAEIDRIMRGFVATARPRFAERHAGGFVREGHGDLRCEHICLDRDTIQIFDCVEFSREIRCADVASDLAFLTMDLRRLEAGEFGEVILAEYETHGLSLPSDLIRFYEAHRALVRVKAACLSLSGADAERRAEKLSEAIDYLDLAYGALCERRPAMIAMTGLSGSGKSTIARRVGSLLSARVVASDEVRKELAGVTGSAGAEWQEGIYTEAWSDRTYERLFELAAEELAAGRPVVLDAAFLSPERRTRAAEIARQLAVPFVLVETVLAEPLAIERIAARAARGDSASDAGDAIYRRQREAVEAHPPGIPVEAAVITVDTGLERDRQSTDLIEGLVTAGLLTQALPMPGVGRTLGRGTGHDADSPSAQPTLSRERKLLGLTPRRSTR